MYDVVLFDLDGTLTDPKTGITKSIHYALTKLGIREDNLDSLVSFIGAPLLESFQERYSLDASKARQAVQFYREYFSEFGIYENAVYPGIPELLMHLRSKGKKLIVATLKPKIFAEKILQHFGIRDFLASVVGSRLEISVPPKTEIIQSALIEASAAPGEKVVMVGDREHDIIGARENGIHSIGVTYGYGSLDELQRAHPTHLANSIEDVKLLIDRGHEVP